MQRHSGWLFLALAALASCGNESPTPSPEANRSTASTTAAQTATAETTATAEASATAQETSTTAEASATTSESAVASVSQSAQTSAKPGTTSSAVASAASASPTASAKEVTGEEKKEAAYSAFMSGAGTYKAGQQGAVTAVVNALGDYKVNEKFPYKFTLNAAPAGVSYPETTVRNVNRSGKKATISIPFTPSSAGNVTISGVYALSVCTPSTCLTEKVPLSITVKVQ